VDLIQIFRRRDSAATGRALRFFKERRLQTSFVDIALRPPAPAELRRFIQDLGMDAILDRAGRAYREAGLAFLVMDERGLIERVGRDTDLLALPLVRWGDRTSAGAVESVWRGWLTEVRGTEARR